MYMPLMRVLADAGVHSVACNQRGYSPDARPPLQTDYNYNTLKSDVFALATAANFEKFHLVGHDHGACLGWVAAASANGAARVLSFTALSIPHVNAFSAGLFGDNSDVKQQVASQYFSMFSMNNSASLDGNFLFNTMGKTSSNKNSDTFDTSADFQKSLWWYNGAFDAGVFALPPTFSATELLLKYGNPAMASLRKIFPGSAAAIAHPEGIPQKNPISNVTMPALYVCGEKDTAILCNRPYALKTSEYCPAGYSYLEVECGHDVLAKGGGDGCATDVEVDKVNTAILAHIKNASALW
jgi:pimeloyl-ACP methyl ester carboxylesterase